jgi:hypothetical protein
MKNLEKASDILNLSKFKTISSSDTASIHSKKINFY